VTPEQIRERIAEIRAARDTGALMVRHGDTLTQFRSLDEMNRIIADLENQLAELEGKPRRKRIGYIIQRSKGL